jgi:hypothetical protein
MLKSSLIKIHYAASESLTFATKAKIDSDSERASEGTTGFIRINQDLGIPVHCSGQNVCDFRCET